MTEQTTALLRWFRRLHIRREIRDDIHQAFMPLAAPSSAGDTPLGVDRWLPAVQEGKRGPVCRTRLEAQRSAEALVRSR